MQINKYTGRPFSQKFWAILEKRKTLPVWEYYTKFMELVKKHQCVVLVGETGSGKTTQVRLRCTHTRTNTRLFVVLCVVCVYVCVGVCRCVCTFVVLYPSLPTLALYTDSSVAD